ncbi:ABC transporter substrate-binding protein [Pelagibacterium sp. 26DY04]|uniref:ABC transporter substrate-binding protein n=1 Tax=Pelagibacterium sp. 26DY04 TaxID=2967130 RepID=UPI002814B769|nr:ABC transporter substrate-binding protein [Pelagibacterium sp. 26DY04]WMT87153.1 ABC transporter substrate-binding protein [Pelagibacterium sp. 26DY04]
MTFKPFLAALATALVAGPALAQDSQVLTDGTGTEITVPADPQRVVSLHDTSLTVALLELGIVPVGSHGRTPENAQPNIRSGKLITGYDFDNSAIEFVGNLPADVEAVAALEPDLILTTDWQTADVGQLRSIAPTYVFPISTMDDFEVYRTVAEVTGTTDELEKLEARYGAQLDMIDALVTPQDITVSVIQANAGELHVWNTYGSLGKVLRDAGFAFPAAIDAIEGNERQIFSGESYPDFDADFIFVTYAVERGETPAMARAALDEVLPGWCEVMHACRNGQIVYVPREIASSATYDSLTALTQIVASHVAGRDYVALGQ